MPTSGTIAVLLRSGGASANSPTLQRWEKAQEFLSPVGTADFLVRRASDALPTRCLLALAMSFALLGAKPAHGQDKNLDALLSRTSQQVSSFVEQFSEVKCTEHVVQEKFAESNKIERRTESTYDYLVILTNSGGELSLDESRLAVAANGGNHKKENEPLLISNGFATLFLIFHPYYAGSFQFKDLGQEAIDGKQLAKVQFDHIPNTKSVAALAVRGREYPLELSGVAWIDPASGAIARIDAGVDRSIEDIGLKRLLSEVEFAPVRFGQQLSSAWFPQRATVEVETPRQHWRNTHRFSDYKQFSVSTEEQVASK
jgi:hypothetical protein